MKGTSKYKIIIDTTERYKKSIKLIHLSKQTEKTVDYMSGDIDVVSSLKTLLERNNLGPQNISEYEPNVGPGTSFTGIKTGVTVANIMNWALHQKKLEEVYKPNYGGKPNIDKTRIDNQQ